MFDVAISFDQPSPFKSSTKSSASKPPSSPPADHADGCKAGVSPGDDFSSRGDITELLESHGWVHTGNSTTDDGAPVENYRRPGKNEGNSATIIDGKVFYCFTSNGQPFEINKSYSLFAVYTLMECGGDFKLAAKELQKIGYGGKTESEKKAKNPAHSEAAKNIANKLFLKLAYDKISENWMEYKNGLWRIISKQDFREKISKYIESDGENFPLPYANHYFRGIVDLLPNYLPFQQPLKNLNILPFKNGVLDLDLKILKDHNPDFYLTWQLPYMYSESSDCEPILCWLLETLDNDNDMVQLLRAFLNAVIRGRVDLHKFLELVGPGGGGKSTFQWLAEQLVGSVNTITTELKHLEKNRFETASIYNKKLVLITDAEKYSGDVSVLKALTGGDPLRYEEKHKQSRSHFQPVSLVMTAANDPFQSSEYTSGLQRRRLPVYFNNPVPEHMQRNLKKEFAPHIAGLLNWALELSDEEVTTIIKQQNSAASKKNLKRNLLDTNPMAAWLHANIIYDPEAETNIGSAPKETTQFGCFEHEGKWLYPNYKKYCDSTGARATSLTRFSRLLDDLCKHQLHLPETSLQDKSTGGRTFKGLRIHNGNPGDGMSPVKFSFY